MRYWEAARHSALTLAPALAWLAFSSGAATVVAQQAKPLVVSEVFEPGQETLWLVEIDGEQIGHNWSRYEGEVELAEIRAHHFREQVMLDAPVPGGRLVQRYTNELWTDPHGRPLRLSFRAAVSDVRASVDATFADGTVQARIRQGPTDRSQEVEIEPDAFILANNFVSQLDLAMALAAPARGEEGALSLFSVNVLRAFPLTLKPVTAEDLGEGAQIDPEIEKIFRDSLGEVLFLDQGGHLKRVEIPAQKLVFRRATAAERAQEKVELFSIELPTAATAAADLDREEVSIEYGEVSLAGTITRPRGSAGRLAAVYFISGSGGQDRNGVSSGIDLGTGEILDRLTREGFLVLRTDDRGVGESTGPTEEMTFDDLVEDARQAVRFLQGRADVDTTRIALIGHSEGGQTAPILAAEMDLGAVVLMAAPGRSIPALIREQLARGKALQGATAEELAELDAQVVAFFAKIGAGAPVDAAELPAELSAFVGARPWLASHMKQDPLANLKKVQEPVLILQGGRDIQVSAERDAPQLSRALEEINHPDFELVVFPELDHLFKKTADGESSGLDYLKERPVDPEFLDTLVEWLKQHLLAG
jgi:pimeloyl-ACP methyl ester carboxylesterase